MVRPRSSSSIVKSGYRKLPSSNVSRRSYAYSMLRALSRSATSDLRFRPHDVAATRGVDQALLKECPRRSLDQVWLSEQVRQPDRGLRSVWLGVAFELGRVSLVEQRDPLFLPGQRRVEELAREDPARIRDHDDRASEFAALRLMHRERVGEFERRGALIAEVARAVVVDEAVPAPRTQLLLSTGDLFIALRLYCPTTTPMSPLAMYRSAFSFGNTLRQLSLTTEITLSP